MVPRLSSSATLLSSTGFLRCHWSLAAGTATEQLQVELDLWLYIKKHHSFTEEMSCDFSLNEERKRVTPQTRMLLDMLQNILFLKTPPLLSKSL